MRRIAWLHIPKCGTSFLTTLLHFANHSLPPDARIPACDHSGRMIFPERDRLMKVNEKCVNAASELTFFQHFPVNIWFKDTFWNAPVGIGRHYELNRRVLKDYDVYTMLRDPTERLASAFYWFRQEFKYKITWKEYYYRAQGTIVKMISGQANGYSCNAGYGRCNMNIQPNLPLAIHRLEQFKFFGLTDHWNLSICLFHKVFNVKCLPSFFANSRKSVYKRKETVEQSARYYDYYDNALYKHGERIFFERLISYSVNAKSCERCWKGAYVRNASY